MSDFTNFGENLVCKVVTGGDVTLPNDLHVALLESADDETYTEVSYTGYQRLAIARSLATWSGTQGSTSTGQSTGSSRAIYNLIDFDFGQAGGSATVNALGIFAGDDQLCYILLQTPIVINENDDVKIAAGTVSLTISNVGGFTDWGVNQLLDYLYRGIPSPFQNAYRMALYVVTPSLAGGGTECAGRGYARVNVNTWGEPENGVIACPDLTQYPAPQGAWGTIQGAGLIEPGGNLVFVNAFQDAKTIPAGAAAPRFPANSITVTVA